MDILGVRNCLPFVLVLSPPLSLAATVQPSDRLVDVNLHPQPTKHTSHTGNQPQPLCFYRCVLPQIDGAQYPGRFVEMYFSTHSKNPQTKAIPVPWCRVSTCLLRSSTRELSKLASHPSIYPSIHPSHPSIHPSTHPSIHPSRGAP